MTREEAIQILNETFINTDGHIKPSNPGKRTALNIHQALVMAIEALLQPSLPSNLDEAAEKYTEDTWLAGENWGDAARRTFKAGAEWMAQQGVSYETVISADKTIPVLPMKDVSEMGFDYGERVIIQIRKK